MKNASTYSLLAVIMQVLLMCGCSKKADNVTGPPAGNGGGGGTAVSDTVKDAFLDSTLAFVATLPHVDPEADNQVVLQYLRSKQTMRSSGIAQPGSVWGQFADGQVFIYINNLFPNGGARAPMAPRGRGRRDMTINNLPTSTRVRLLNGLGSPFEPAASSTIDDIRSWCNTAGYFEPVGSPDASVDGLKQVQGDGVFYMSSHGGFAGASGLVYAVWTTDEVNLANDTRFKLDLDSGYVIKLCCDIEHSAHYGITSKFVQRYMSFASTSLVMFNACNSDESGFKAACQAKNATVYVGWDKPTNEDYMFDVMRFLFDRLLGANQYQAESPPQRPFYYTVVKDDMHARSLDISISPHYGTATLQFTPPFQPVSETSLKLAPSIIQVVPIASPGNTMDITGLFGSDQGTVTVGTTPLNNVTWRAARITCATPETGGNLTVKVRGIKSNVVQLTQWHGQFNYTLTSRGSLRHHVLLDLTFWADVHDYRLLPHRPTFFFNPRYAHLCTSSQCTFESSGEYRDQNDSLVESWSGSGFAPVLVTGTEPSYYYFVGVVDSSASNSSLLLVFRGAFTKNGVQTNFAIQGNLGTLSPRMNSSFVLPGNTLTWSSGTDNATMTWGDMQPSFAPDPAGGR